MNKRFQYYIASWAVLLVLYNVIAFAYQAGPGEFTANFWIGYIFVLLAFCGQLICARIAFKEENLQKLFYHLPLITVSYTALIFSFVFSAICAVIPPIPAWLVIIVCAIILAVAGMSVITAKAAPDIVSSVDERVKSKTLFIKSLTVDAETLRARARNKGTNGGEMEQCVSRVYEAVRYSDPMSHEALSSIEGQITVAFAALAEAVDKEDSSAVKKSSDEIVILLNDRNKKCKLLK